MVRVVKRYHGLFEFWNSRANICFDKYFKRNYSRDSLYDILKSETSINKNEVLVPTTVCGDVIDAILQSGCKPVFYQEDINMDIDEAKIIPLLTNRTRALIIVDFFGTCQLEVSELILSELRGKNVQIIYDLAHCFLKIAKDEFPPKFDPKRDYVVSSAHKMVGGVNGSLLITDAMVCKHEYSPVKQILGLLKQYVKYRFFFPGKKKVNSVYKSKVQLYPSLKYCLAWRLFFSHQNYHEMIRIRLENMLLLMEVVKRFYGGPAVSELDRKKGPQGEQIGLVYEINDTNNLEYLCMYLRKLKIDAYIWPAYHVSDNRPTKRRFLILPITKGYTEVLEEGFKCLDT